MTSAELTLAVVGIVAAAAALIYLIVRRPPEDAKIKWFLIVAAAVLSLAGVASLSGLRGVPGKASTYMKSAAFSIEEYLDANSPDASTQPISTEKLRSLLEDRKQLQSFVDENDHVGFIVDMLASRALLGNIADLCDETEQMMYALEAEDKPLTVHNALEYVLVRADDVVCAKVASAQKAVLIIAAIALVLVLVFYFSALKGWFTTKTGGVTFGDGV